MDQEIKKKSIYRDINAPYNIAVINLCLSTNYNCSDNVRIF